MFCETQKGVDTYRKMAIEEKQNRVEREIEDRYHRIMLAACDDGSIF